MTNTNVLRISQSVKSDDIPWCRIAEVVSKLFHLSTSQSQKEVRSFKKALYKPLLLKWFLLNKIDSTTNRIATTICQYYSADQITIKNERSIRIGALSFEYEQEILFKPNLRREIQAGQKGTCSARYLLSIFGRRFSITTLNQLLIVQILLSLLLFISYLAISALTLYASSVFILFLYNPYASTIAATVYAPFGIALLSFLVVTAAIFGKAFRNVISLFLKRGFFRKGSMYASKVRTQSVSI